MRISLCTAMLSLGLISVDIAYADHPSQGDATLSSLVEEAMRSNIEIQQAAQQLQVSQTFRKQAEFSYLPTLDFEGGIQQNTTNRTSNTAPFAYGKANFNLYNGGKTSAEIAMRNAEESYSKNLVEKTKAKIEREVAKKYYELLYIQEGIAVKEAALKINASHLTLAIRKRTVGYTSKADVLEFELRKATLDSDINFLKREEAKNERELRRIIGRSEGPVIRVGGHLQREAFRKNLAELLQVALVERTELQEAQKNIVLAKLKNKALLGNYLPSVDLEGKYGRLDTDDGVADTYNNSMLMLKVTVPIFSRLDTYYGRKSMAHELISNELNATRIRQEITVDLENAIAKLKSIEDRLNLEERNIERSQEYYDITISEYKKGTKNSPDVAGAAERLFDSQLRNLEFRKEFYLARIEIADASGLPIRYFDK